MYAGILHKCPQRLMTKLQVYLYKNLLPPSIIERKKVLLSILMWPLQENEN